MKNITKFGNALYTGERSYPFVAKRRTWFTVAVAILLILAAGTLLRGGFQFGIEFTGGTEIRAVGISTEAGGVDLEPAEEVMGEALGSTVDVRVSTLGQDGIRIESAAVDNAQTQEIIDSLAGAYSIERDDITSSQIGPSWGADVSRQALIGLITFVVLATIVMAIYFRTWKMSLAALIALAFDGLATAGTYGLVGFEVTPAALIGFLTILSYSLYDTVVVFDKIRENTAPGGSGTYLDKTNLAINQTLMRSINTSVVGLLPVAAIFFIGSFLLGAGTLRDIALALMIGMFVGTWSTIFIAAPMYAEMRKNDTISTEVKRKQERGAVV